MRARMRNLVALLGQGRELPAYLYGMVDQVTLPGRAHMDLTADALLRYSCYSTDGGYSISHSLLHGWQRGYVETTGYIVPTALDLAAALDRPELREDALLQGEWLLQHQRPDGSFQDITREQGAAFDTGQVLMGLDRLFVETGDPRYAEAGRMACDWFCTLAQPDGRWSGASDTQTRCPTYLTRSAAAMIAHGRLTRVERYVGQGKIFLDWAIAQQLPSGLFRNSELTPGAPYLLHTIVYVLEGLLDGYRSTGESRYLEAARRGAEGLLRASLTREITLRSFYNEHLEPTTTEKCLTGLAQWAGVCLGLFEITGDERYVESASNTLFYLKSKQLRVQGKLRGGLPGSVPIWGHYLKLSYPSWNLKFFADALLAWQRLGLDESRQQEIFVATSHRIYGGKVGWTESSLDLAKIDRKVLERLEKVIETDQGAEPPLVVDLGCGEGRHLDWLEARHPDWRFVGIDPQPPSRSNRRIEAGTANRIPLADGSASCVYASIALQHVSDIDAALAEIRRVLRPGGVFVLFDRNPLSLRGLLKPWHEIRGRWLYSWDAPFRERWYGLGRWRSMLRRAGFRIRQAQAMAAHEDHGWRRYLPINRFVYVVAQAAPIAAAMVQSVAA